MGQPPLWWRIRESVAAWIAYRLPRRVVAWCVLRVMAYVGKGMEVPGKVSIGYALEKWMDHELPR